MPALNLQGLRLQGVSSRPYLRIEYRPWNQRDCENRWVPIDPDYFLLSSWQAASLPDKLLNWGLGKLLDYHQLNRILPTQASNMTILFKIALVAGVVLGLYLIATLFTKWKTSKRGRLRPPEFKGIKAAAAWEPWWVLNWKQALNSKGLRRFQHGSSYKVLTKCWTWIKRD